MHKPSLTCALFSLFIPPERANEMEGDLIEQSRTSGTFWYALQVPLVAFALFVRTFMKTPISILLVSAAGFTGIYAGLLGGELLTVSQIGAYLSSEVELSVTWFRIVMLSLTVAPVGFLTGFSFVRLAPLRGFTASLLALLLFIGFLTVLQIYIYPLSLIWTNVLKVTFAGIPLLLGAGVANSRNLRRYKAT